jgi:deoxyribodipyrimidine photo-lyase
MKRPKVSIFWFRRDLRINDNHGLFKALNSNYPVLPIFIFDTNIVEELERDDGRVSFIYERLLWLNNIIKKHFSGIYLIKDKPEKSWEKILIEFDVKEVYFNEDYEPYAIKRDTTIQNLLRHSNISCNSYKDQVIFSKSEIVKDDHTPYSVFTPYKNKWLQQFKNTKIKHFDSQTIANYYPHKSQFPKLSDLGFSHATKKVVPYNIENLDSYEKLRNYPGMNGTSNLSTHLRFGTISIRRVVMTVKENEVFLSELIWREFFMQILYHFPKVVHSNFKRKYDAIEWRNNREDFEKWKNGRTGYPMVDAGMRELNATGYMHNRVRMVVAGFLCKHLLVDWRWGEAYFAEKLLDYELASNNGNWQWSAGTGCDAAPYFRIFNPAEQVKKFDPELSYVKKWIPELNSLKYPSPMVDHKKARIRAIEAYKKGLQIKINRNN